MKNKLLETAQKIVNYVHSNMGESCQCMFCGHHHIHTDETNMQERYEKSVCPFVEFERVVIEAAQPRLQSDKGKDAVDLAFDEIVEDTVYGEGA